MPQFRLAIVCTHPIQYYAPVFRELAQSGRMDLRVFYTWSQTQSECIYDAGFGTSLKWDVPLLAGYPYQFVANVAKHPGVHHFRGVNTPTLASEIERWKPDALLVYTWNSWSHLQALRYFKGRLPVFFRGDSTLIDPKPWWRAMLRRIFLRWVYSHVDVAIAVGSNNRDYFRWCGLPANCIALAPHSIDTVRFAANAAEHNAMAMEWRKEMGIASNAVVILYAGKLQPKKNPVLLLDAFNDVAGAAHLVFVGNGELESELKARAKNCGNVHFMPFKNQSVMPAVYLLGDLFVLPSQGPEETWGLAINEAMASGRAVVASSMVGGACDLVQPERNGWIFESGSRSDLASLLRRAIALGRPGLHAMGRAAQAGSIGWSTEESARCIGDAVIAHS